jgi:hypothetical protein
MEFRNVRVRTSEGLRHVTLLACRGQTGVRRESAILDCDLHRQGRFPCGTPASSSCTAIDRPRLAPRRFTVPTPSSRADPLSDSGYRESRGHRPGSRGCGSAASLLLVVGQISCEGREVRGSTPLGPPCCPQKGLLPASLHATFLSCGEPTRQYPHFLGPRRTTGRDPQHPPRERPVRGPYSALLP